MTPSVLVVAFSRQPAFPLVPVSVRAVPPFSLLLPVSAISCLLPLIMEYGGFRLTAPAHGMLTLPAVLKRGLSIVPGDILSLQSFPPFVQLEIYREFLADRWELVALEAQWKYVEGFLVRTLTAVDAKGRLPIPRAILDVRRGEAFRLQVFNRWQVHTLFLFRLPPKPPQKQLGIHRIAGQIAAPGCEARISQ